MRVKVRAERALSENGISICQGAVFEVSFERARWLERVGAVEIMEMIPGPEGSHRVANDIPKG